VLRKIYAPKRDEVTGSRGVEKTTCLQNNIWVIKLRRMRWAGHVTGIEERSGEERRGACMILMGKEITWKTCVDGSIILKWVLKKWDGTSWTESIWLRIGTVSGRLCMR
jgi:hypothetical protein